MTQWDRTGRSPTGSNPVGATFRCLKNRVITRVFILGFQNGHKNAHRQRTAQNSTAEARFGPRRSVDGSVPQRVRGPHVRHSCAPQVPTGRLISVSTSPCSHLIGRGPSQRKPPAAAQTPEHHAKTLRPRHTGLRVLHRPGSNSARPCNRECAAPIASMSGNIEVRSAVALKVLRQRVPARPRGTHPMKNRRRRTSGGLHFGSDSPVRASVDATVG